MPKRIGEFYVERGVLTPEQAREILNHAFDRGLRFGEAALDLGLLTREKMQEVFGPNYNVDFFNLEVGTLPASVKGLLPVEEILRLGALPLGFKTEASLLKKRRSLVLGLLDPSREDAVQGVEDLVRAKVGGGGSLSGTRKYLLLPEQFLDVLAGEFGISESALAAKAQMDLDPTLREFLAVNLGQ